MNGMIVSVGLTEWFVADRQRQVADGVRAARRVPRHSGPRAIVRVRPLARSLAILFAGLAGLTT